MSDEADTSQAPLRAFVAIPVPRQVQEGLATALDRIRDSVPRKSVRWVQPENIHLTLRFFGDVLASDVAPMQRALREAVRGVEPFILRLAEPGCFPDARSPRVLWVGLGGDLERLARLQAQVIEATQVWGPLEERGFHPHLTLGRVVARRPGELREIAGAIRALAVPACAPWRVHGLQLMRSVLASGGSRYSTLASLELTAGAAPAL